MSEPTAVDLPRMVRFIALAMRNRAARLAHLDKEAQNEEQAAALLRCGRRLLPELENLALMLTCQAEAGDFDGHVAVDGDGCRVFPADVWQRLAEAAGPAAELAADLAAREGVSEAVARYCALVEETATVVEQAAAAMPKPTHAERWGLASASA